MKLNFTAVALTLCLGLNAQLNYWKNSSDKDVILSGKRQIIPNKYLVVNLNYSALKTQLLSAPNEKATSINNSNCILSIPAPNGDIQLFKVVEAPIMEATLANAYPDIKTYSIKGITDVNANGKIDVNEFGFHGMIKTINGDYFIDPYCVGNTADYISYYTSDFEKPMQDRVPEANPIAGEQPVKKKDDASNSLNTTLTNPGACGGANLRTYRLAVACTGEYAVAATGSATPTTAQTLAKIVTSVNRVDGVYETEVSIRLVLVATETNVVFTNANTDPFTGNNNANTLLGESQTVITNTIGSANFDIGHTFSTGGGGLAGLGVVCTASQKAKGITGSPSPVGDPYDIDYVAHEMGHEFGANHPFNSILSNCGGGNRNASTAVEPGSGVTIMGYAGICGADDLAAHSIAYFHATSYDEIVNYTTLGAGNGCPVTTTTGNLPPVVSINSSSYNIPASTPFTLTGSATDPNGDPLTYSWEENDVATVAGVWNSGNKPFFRSYVPTTSGTRSFPIQSSVINNSYQTVIGEYLPSTSQVLKFRLTARDNKMGGGGVCYSTSTVNISATAGPFQITYPNAVGITWYMGQPQTITWDVNATNAAPINVSNVNILISYNNGNTFTTLLANTANDGSELITVPTLSVDSYNCYIKIESVANIFYDINTPNFAIIASATGLASLSRCNPLGMIISPNPFVNEFQLRVPVLNSSSKTEVVITDVVGKQVKQLTYDKVSALDERIDLSDLDAAVYFITVLNNNKKTTARIIKN